MTATDTADAKDGSEIATLPAAQTGTADETAAKAQGKTLGDQIDALHAQHFTGTELGHNTKLWNLVHAFKEDVKTLVQSEPPAAHSL